MSNSLQAYQAQHLSGLIRVQSVYKQIALAAEIKSQLSVHKTLVLKVPGAKEI